MVGLSDTDFIWVKNMVECFGSVDKFMEYHYTLLEKIHTSRIRGDYMAALIVPEGRDKTMLKKIIFKELVSHEGDLDTRGWLPGDYDTLELTGEKEQDLDVIKARSKIVVKSGDIMKAFDIYRGYWIEEEPEKEEKENA